jgi:predicted dienelactone hydrolase
MIDRRQVMAGMIASVGLAAAPVRAINMPGAVQHRRESFSHADGRAVPLDIWTPASKGPFPLMVFSHGANSRADKYEELCRPLAAMGYIVIGITHADSPDHPGGGKVEMARATAMRLEDMRGLIRSRATWGADPAAKVIAAGHSYGALMAQILIGARVEAEGATRATPADPADDDVLAALAYSPPGEWTGIPANSWETVRKPMLVQTGTADVLPGLADTWEKHRLSFDTTPAPAVLFVGEGVDHYFGNLICRPERTEAPQRIQLDSALAVSQAFLSRVKAGESLTGLKAMQVPMGRIEVRA